MNTLPDGAWPVMLTPYTDDLRIDWDALDRYTDWLIEHGASGLFPVALSGEMYDLSEDERLAVAARVVTRAATRVPVIASVVETGGAAEYSAAVARMAATGVDAVVIIASLVLAEGQDESGLTDKLAAILAANPDVDFGIYECPVPNHRILSTDAVAWMAQTGRFVFFKETSHDVALMADRVEVSKGTRMKVYNAGIETLVESLHVGVSGLSGWVVNVYPEHVAWLCATGRDLDLAVALEAQAALDRVERGMGPTYPNSAKFLVAERGVDFPVLSRWNSKPVNEGDLLALASTFDASELPVLDGAAT